MRRHGNLRSRRRARQLPTLIRAIRRFRRAVRLLIRDTVAMRRLDAYCFGIDLADAASTSFTTAVKVERETGEIIDVVHMHKGQAFTMYTQPHDEAKPKEPHG